MEIPLSASQIADQLAALIRSGTLRPGEKLPIYGELSARHGIAPSTAAAVMLRLRERGLVVGVPGKGCYVREDESAVPSSADGTADL